MDQGFFSTVSPSNLAAQMYNKTMRKYRSLFSERKMRNVFSHLFEIHTTDTLL